MMDFMKGLMTKKSTGAFRGPLNCPLCNNKGDKRSKWKYMENIGPYRIRYKCKDCHSTIQYDYSRQGLNIHPYSPWNKPHFQRIVDKQKRLNLPV